MVNRGDEQKMKQINLKLTEKQLNDLENYLMQWVMLVNQI